MDLGPDGEELFPDLPSSQLTRWKPLSLSEVQVGGVKYHNNISRKCMTFEGRAFASYTEIYMYVHGGYGRVYTVYDFGVDLDNWIMYVCYFLA